MKDKQADPTLEEIQNITDNIVCSFIGEKAKRAKDGDVDREIKQAIAEARLAEAKIGEQRIRELLWATHPCNGKYGDDGELQCGVYLPPIDFKRDSWEAIAQGIEWHTKQRIEEADKHRLDRPDREKIAEFLYSENELTLLYDGVTFDKCKEIYPEKAEGYLGQADQTQDLLPDAEEIRKEAKQEERERILKMLLNYKAGGWVEAQGFLLRVAQALKEEKC